MITVKRVYDSPGKDEQVRILVDRLWPRGVTREEAKIDIWLKDVAPSDALRKWYSHDRRKWSQFKKRYTKELNERGKQVNIILGRAKVGPVTLLFGSHEPTYNNAIALKEYLEKQVT